MPDDINKRMNYFDRQFLRAADFKVEQEYHLHRHRLHNKLLHTAGVATEKDLKVTGEAGTDMLTIAEGIAIDEQGREIMLLQQHHHPIDPGTKAGNYELTVRLDEVPSDFSSDPGVEGATRINEEPIFELLAPDKVKPSMLRLAAIEVQDDGKLKSPPISIRKFAGTSIGESVTADSVTANTLTLKESDIHIAKWPDLSSTTSGDILFRTTRPADSTPKESLRITTTGFLKSPMWNATSVYVNERAINIPTNPSTIICAPKTFKTGGGILLIFASGSGQASGTELTIGMDLLVENTVVGKAITCVNDTTEAHKPFMTSGLVVRNIASGEHTLTLKTTISTKIGLNDFFNVTILELPFQ
jgi:hypothetical protein